MQPSLAQRIGALLKSRDDSSIELVMTGNGLAALAISAAAWLRAELSLGWVAALAAAVFILLTICLLSKYTVWISACVGGLTLAVTPAFILGALAQDLHPLGQWAGRALGFVIGLIGAVWTYARVGRIASANG